LTAIALGREERATLIPAAGRIAPGTNECGTTGRHLRMIYEKGDRVVAAQRIGGVLNPLIRRGTRGVVTAVAFYADEVIVTVAFSNGRIENMSPDQIAAADNDPSR
jgi:hypothetical protein